MMIPMKAACSAIAFCNCYAVAYKNYKEPQNKVFKILMNVRNFNQLLVLANQYDQILVAVLFTVIYIIVLCVVMCTDKVGLYIVERFTRMFQFIFQSLHPSCKVFLNRLEYNTIVILIYSLTSTDSHYPDHTLQAFKP